MAVSQKIARDRVLFAELIVRLEQDTFHVDKNKWGRTGEYTADQLIALINRIKDIKAGG